MSLMESIAKSMKGSIALIATKKAGESLDGKEITRNLDKIIDEQFGKKHSEKIQRGPISNFLHQMQEGLYEESPMTLAAKYEIWAEQIRKAHGQA